MLATVTEGQEQEDASTAASHGDVSSRWLNVCKKEIAEGSNEDRWPGDAQLGRRTQCRREENHSHHRFGSSSVSRAKKTCSLLCRRVEDPRTDSIEWPTGRRYSFSEEKR